MKMLKIIGRLIKKLLAKFQYTVVDTSKFGTYNKEKYFAIPKGRYLLARREDVDYDLMADFDNSIKTYDQIWTSTQFVDNYSSGKRAELYKFVANICLNVLKDGDDKNAWRNVADVGAGPGSFLQVLRNTMISRGYNLRYYGVDFSPASIEKCKLIIPDGIFKIGDIHNLPFEDSYFDFVFCVEVLEHVQFVENALKELQRICKPSGYIYITIPDGRIDNWVGHINFWSESDFRQLLEKRGMQIDIYYGNPDFMVFSIRKI